MPFDGTCCRRELGRVTGSAGLPLPCSVRQLHPWAPLCTIPTARSSCPTAGTHLARHPLPAPTGPRVTGMGTPQLGEPGMCSRSSWDDDPRTRQLPRASCTHWLVWAQAGVGPQALCAQNQCQPPDFPSPGAVTVSALSSGPRWSICFQSSSTSRKVQGWLQTLFPGVLASIPGEFLCLENRITSQSMDAEFQHRQRSQCHLHPQGRCTCVLSPCPYQHTHPAPTFLHPLCSLGAVWGSPGGHSNPTLSQIMRLPGGVGAAPHPGCASPSPQRLMPNPG